MNWRRIIYGLLALLLIGLIAAWWWRPTSVDHRAQLETKAVSTPLPSPTTVGTYTLGQRPTPVRPDLAKAGVPEKNVPDVNQISSFLSVFKTPISFYGKVIDEKNNPIEGATVTFMPVKEIDPNRQNPQYSAISDKDGLFSITGISGADLNVNVSKSGYYRMPPTDGHRGSYGSFTYGGVSSNNSSAPPTEDAPAIFMLRKKGNGTQLTHWGRSIQRSTDGTPVTIRLATGQSSADGDLQIESWTDDQERDEHGHYPWSCQVSINDGGALPRDGEFNFEAPADGYQPYAEIAPTKERWTSGAERQYFVKTASGNYARVRVEILTGRDQLLTVETYYNPAPGDQNLEPAQQ